MTFLMEIDILDGKMSCRNISFACPRMRHAAFMLNIDILDGNFQQVMQVDPRPVKLKLCVSASYLKAPWLLESAAYFGFPAV